MTGCVAGISYLGVCRRHRRTIIIIRYIRAGYGFDESICIAVILDGRMRSEARR